MQSFSSCITPEAVWSIQDMSGAEVNVDKEKGQAFFTIT
jgi:hypothetical protein